ncbi:MAG TPA: hypothetical protein VNM89_01795 [Solirubrobacterales bacterium]|nr:hypothetical protein [Solirubrobacterales bacterium]
MLAWLVAAALAPPAEATAPQFWQKCPTGSGAEQCNIPRGIGVDPSNGHIYVADQQSQRINKFTAWGEFLRTWGWDVVLSGPGNVSTAPDPPQFEICVPADGDICKAGVSGVGVGQLNLAQGIAVDLVGNVYVVDFSNRRVQKFDSEGNFLLMFGGNVNKTKVEAAAPEGQRNLCPVDPGDVCQTGTQGTGNGQFGAWSSTGGSFIATSSDGGTIYVGDQARIQQFDTAGSYQGDLPNPEGLLTANTVKSLAVDPGSGDLYLSFANKGTVAGEANPPNVYRLDPVSGEQIDQLAVGIPTGVAVDANGDVYVFDDDAPGDPSSPGNHILRILRFDPEGEFKEVYDRNESEFVKNRFTAPSTGLATSSACGIPGSALYVSSSTNPAFIRAYGPAPTDLEACPPPSVPPTISGTFAHSVGTDGAVLEARINPHFWPDTTYRVQYGDQGPCSANPCAEQPLPPGALLTDQILDAELSVEVSLSGLQPDTIYHYRFLAQSSGGGPVFGPDKSLSTFAEPDPPPSCPNDEFRTDTPSAILPDCRAYELVSPVDKNGGDVGQGGSAGFFPAQDGGAFPTSSALDKLDQASPGGEALTYSSYRAFAGAEAGAWTNQYLASRDPEVGWQTEPLSPPESGLSFYVGQAQILHFLSFTPDLCSALYLGHTDNSIALGDIPGFPDLYRRDNCQGTGFEALTTTAPPTLPPDNFMQALGSELTYRPLAEGLSADGQVSVFRANDRLTPDASAATDTDGNPIFQLYLKAPDGLHLLSVLPDGSPAPTHSTLGGRPGGAANASLLRFDNVRNAVSEDGSRVYWTTTNTAPSGGSGNDIAGPGRIYLRLNPEQPQSPIAAGECTDPALACTIAVSESVGADPAHFHTASSDGSTALFSFASGAHAGELYSFDLATETATQIATGFTGLVGAADDLSSVYFTSGASIYLWRQAEGDSFIAALSGFEAPGVLLRPSPAHTAPPLRTSRVTPDGAVAIFVSAASLTGYDNTDAASGQPDSEVFRYDAEADGGNGELLCVSCNPSGGRPMGAKVVNDIWAAARIPGWDSPHHPSRALSADGDRVFFNSFDALDPRDTNGKQDVYQWQAPGSGDCEATDWNFYEENGGCLALITQGTGNEDSEFVEASADGSDVFVRSRSQLHPVDVDSLLDIYDARIDGGFPAPPPAPAPCDLPAGACEGPGSEDPQPQGAGSAVFEGQGNPPTVFSGDCRAAARRAQAARAAAAALRKRARQAQSPERAARLRRRAAALSRKAKAAERNTKRCRATSNRSS